MSAVELGVRMSIGQSRASALERAELSGSIRLSTLIRAAEALHCELVYALVPDGFLLEDIVWRQAFHKASEKLGADLDEGDHGEEAESFLAIALSEQVEALAFDLIDRRGLWAESRRGQVPASAGPTSSDPPPESWSGFP